MVMYCLYSWKIDRIHIYVDTFKYTSVLLWYMGKQIKVRKSGNSLVMTIPSSIAEMFNLSDGSEVEIEAQGIDSFRVRCR